LAGLNTRQRHYNLVFLHARQKTFPVFADIVLAVQEIWPWGEVASVARTLREGSRPDR
jgi:hypothetical protein